MKNYTVYQRERVLVNTDSQGRCYNGCHYKSELQWSSWDWLVLNVPEDGVADTLVWWRDLNDYAVESRGESARKEFKAVLNP